TAGLLGVLLVFALKAPSVDDPGVRDRDPSLAINQECDRHGRDVVLLCHLWCGDNYRIRHGNIAASLRIFLAREEWADRFPTVIIHGCTNCCETVLSILAIESDIPGNFQFAAAAPRGPEVEKYDLAAIAAERNRLALRIDQRE